MDSKINTRSAYRPVTERSALIGHTQVAGDVERPQGSQFRSVLATFIAALGALSFGYSLGFSSPGTTIQIILPSPALRLHVMKQCTAGENFTHFLRIVSPSSLGLVRSRFFSLV